MKRNHFLSLLLVLAMMLSTVSLCIIPAAAEGASDTWDGTADTAWYGDGTATEYTISTPAQLAGLASIVNAGTDTFAGKTVVLGADLILNEDTIKGTVTNGFWTPATDNNSKQWTPIGTETAPFGGTFDGKGHTISGLYYYGDLVYAGLFGVIENAILSNINVGIGYLCTTKYCATMLSMGTVVAYAISSTVQNCTSYADCNYAIHQTNYGYVGGIIGYICGESSVVNCKNYGSVTGYNNHTSGNAGMYVGGIVGYYSGQLNDAATDPIAEMYGCQNYGTLTATINHNNKYGNIGGIAGFAENVSIHDCSNYAKIAAGTNGKKYNVAGLVGWLYGGVHLYRCSNNGDISASNAAAGIFAYASDIKLNAKSYVYECVNHGNILTGAKYAGGISGYVYQNSKYQDLCVYANINYGTVTGSQNVAGIGLIAAQQNAHFCLYNNINFGNVIGEYRGTNLAVAGGVYMHSNPNKGEAGNNINVGKVSINYVSEIVADTTVTVGQFSNRDMSQCAKNYYFSAGVEIATELASITTIVSETYAVAVSADQLNGTDTTTLVNGKSGLINGLNANTSGAAITWYQGKTCPLPYYFCVQELTVSAASVTLGDKVAVNFYVENAGAAAALDYTLTVDGQKLVGTDTADGKYTVYTVADIDAKDLLKNYEITLTVPTEDGTDVITTDTLTYGVSKYIDRMSGKGNDKLDALLAALSDYAKAAAGEDVDVDEAYAAVELVPVANVDATYVEAIALDLTDSIRPIIKVADGVAQVTVAIYGETYTYAVVDGEVIIDCLTATSLNNEMVLSFLDAEGTVLGTTGYAVANYIKSVETLDLAKALAVYMQAARAYNGLD